MTRRIAPRTDDVAAVDGSVLIKGEVVMCGNTIRFGDGVTAGGIIFTLPDGIDWSDGYGKTGESETGKSRRPRRFWRL